MKPALEQKSNSLGWGSALVAVLVVFLGLTAMFFQTAANMVAIWWNYETYAHGFLIVPIAGWLIWNKRLLIKPLIPSPQYLALFFVAGGGFVWLLGDLINAEIVKQISLIMMLVASIWTVLGNRVSYAILFPLLFLFFMVPVGEDLVPPMMEFTASFTIKLLQLTGIPVYREGLFFSLPSGDWSVVKACSGIRYLIASVTLGCVFAYVTYQSLSKRLIFIAVSFIVPVLANGLRAYMIVMIGHLSGMELAVGVDHLIYGWLFFGVVMFIMFAIGSRWADSDDQVSVTVSPIQSNSSKESGSPRKMLGAALAILVISAVWPLFSSGIESYNVVEKTSPLVVPQGRDGWQIIEGEKWSWKPSYKGTDNELLVFYKKESEVVSLYLGQYLKQSQGSELINVGNRLVSKDETQWRKVSSRAAEATLSNKKISLEESELTNRSDSLLVWRVYRLDQRYTSNRYIVKLLEIKSKLTFSRQDAAVMVFATHFEIGRDDSRQHAAERLQSYVDEFVPQIEHTLDAVAGSEL